MNLADAVIMVFNCGGPGSGKPGPCPGAKEARTTIARVAVAKAPTTRSRIPKAAPPKVPTTKTSAPKASTPKVVPVKPKTPKATTTKAPKKGTETGSQKHLKEVQAEGAKLQVATTKARQNHDEAKRKLEMYTKGGTVEKALASHSAIAAPRIKELHKKLQEAQKAMANLVHDRQANENRQRQIQDDIKSESGKKR